MLKVSMVKNSLRDYYQIPAGKQDLLQLSTEQISIINSTPSRFHDLDFFFCPDDFLWKEIIPMRASIKYSLHTIKETPLLVTGSYSKLYDYQDTNKEGRLMERYQSNAASIGLQRMTTPLFGTPSCMMISKEWLNSRYERKRLYWHWEGGDQGQNWKRIWLSSMPWYSGLHWSSRWCQPL